MKLTAKTIDTIQLLPGQKERVVRDDELTGFQLRIRAGGSRVFIFQYRLGKLKRRMTLGPAVKEAFPGIRQRVLDLIAQVRLGQDPAGAKKAAIEAAQVLAVGSFKNITELYLATQIKRLNPRTYRDLQKFLMDRAKMLHGLPLVAITRRELATMLNAVEASVTRGKGSATANKMRSYLSMLFNWAMREGLCDTNPVGGTNRRDQPARTRVLSMDELVKIWHALPDSRFGSAAKLLMLTAQRRQEFGNARWSEMHLEKGYMILPGRRSKNKREHIIPLSEPACVILTQQYQIKRQDTIFSRNENGMSAWGQRKAALDKKLPGMPHWTLHDLRRSVCTHMAEDLGVLPHIIEAIINHQSGTKAGVAGIYNRALYLKEKTAALALWAEHLMAAVTGEPAKVVPLYANRA
jgi:integrase